MAVITTTSPGDQVGEYAITPTTMTAADTLVYKPSVTQTLYLNNTTAGSLTVKIDGDGVTTVVLPGQGVTTNNANGYDVIVAAGVMKAVRLAKVRNYLKGVINLTGGTGIKAWVQED